jgi:hypothetical protein
MTDQTYRKVLISNSLPAPIAEGVYVVRSQGYTDTPRDGMVQRVELVPYDFSIRDVVFGRKK